MNARQCLFLRMRHKPHSASLLNPISSHMHRFLNIHHLLVLAIQPALGFMAGASKRSHPLRKVFNSYYSQLKQFVRPGGEIVDPRFAHPNNTLENILTTEGVGSIKEYGAIKDSFPTRPALSVLMEKKGIDDTRFVSIWSRASGLESVVLTPEDIDDRLMDGWSEEMANEYRAIPITWDGGGKISMAFTEPPSPSSLKGLQRHFDRPVSVRLLSPNNLASLCDEIYPDRVLQHRHHQLRGLLASLDTKARRETREKQMTLHCSLPEAFEHMSLKSRDEVREINALANGAIPKDLSQMTLGVPLLKTLTPLFCELHGILPLHNGSIAINNRPHPHTISKIQDIIGEESLTFVSDTPVSFMEMWRDFSTLRFSQDTLLEQLVLLDLVSITQAEQIRDARRLLDEPIDRLLVQLNLVPKNQVFHAIRATSSLDMVTDRVAGEPMAILPRDRSDRIGLRTRHLTKQGITFQTSRLPSPGESSMVMRRCGGIPWKFELSTALRDLPSPAT